MDILFSSAVVILLLVMDPIGNVPCFAERITKLIGERGLIACERLKGLLLTAIAVEMLLRGIQSFVQQLSVG